MYVFVFVHAGAVRKLSVSGVLCTANSKASFHPGEPDGPSVKTDVPGPRSQQLLAELSSIQVIQAYTCQKSYSF